MRQALLEFVIAYRRGRHGISAGAGWEDPAGGLGRRGTALCVFSHQGLGSGDYRRSPESQAAQAWMENARCPGMLTGDALYADTALAQAKWTGVRTTFKLKKTSPNSTPT